MRFLDKYATREKELRHLGREAARLQRAKWHAPIVPLGNAYQRGWVKHYVLAPGIDRRPDAQIFRTVLEIVNRRIWARERTFLHPRTRQPMILRPRMIPFREMEKLGWPASHQRLFMLGTWKVQFEEIATRNDWERFRWGRLVYGYKLARTWWLREDIQPHLITHQRVDLPDVNSRLAKIESFMAHCHGWDRLNRLRGRRCWRNYWRAEIGAERDRRYLVDQLADTTNET